MQQLLEADIEMDDQDLVLKAYEDALKDVQGMLDKVKQQMSTKPGTSGDYCRLIQLQIDLQQMVNARNIKEIKATWLDPESLNEE